VKQTPIYTHGLRGTEPELTETVQEGRIIGKEKERKLGNTLYMKG
jgi:hypothetical protein